MIKPQVIEHDGVLVVRDDLYEGGTKARFIPLLFNGDSEVVYASPAEGGAQTALATVASQLGNRATIFVAQRAQLHPRTLIKRLGAQIVPVSPGYLNVVQARAIKYSHQTGAVLAPFGFHIPGATQAIAAGSPFHWNTAGRSVVCCWFRRPGARSSSGLAKCQPSFCPGWPRVDSTDVADAVIYIYPEKFGWVAKKLPPFPSDPHYD